MYQMHLKNISKFLNIWRWIYKFIQISKSGLSYLLQEFTRLDFFPQYINKLDNKTKLVIILHWHHILFSLRPNFGKLKIY